MVCAAGLQRGRASTYADGSSIDFLYIDSYSPTFFRYGSRLFRKASGTATFSGGSSMRSSDERW